MEHAEHVLFGIAGGAALGKQPVQAPRLSGRGQEVGVVLRRERTNRVGQQDLAVAHHHRQAHAVGQGVAAQHGAAGSDPVADHVVIQLSWQVELDPPRIRVVARHRDPEPVRSASQAPALHDQRHQHHHEGHVEEQPRVGQFRQQRNGRQEDPDRAAQAHPRDEADLAQSIAERRQAQRDRDRARHEHQEGRHAERGPDVVDQAAGRCQQAQQQEHDQLREPGGGILHRHHFAARAYRPVGDHHPGQIHGEIPAGIDQVGQREHSQRAGHGQPWVQAGRQRQVVERDHDQAPADVPEQHAADQRPRHLRHHHSNAHGLGACKPAGQGDGQEHGDRIVGARFDFQRAPGATLQVQAPGA